MKSNSQLGTAAYGIALLIFLIICVAEIGPRGICIGAGIFGIIFATVKYKKKNVVGMLFGFCVAICATLILILLK